MFFWSMTRALLKMRALDLLASSTPPTSISSAQESLYICHKTHTEGNFTKFELTL